VVDDNHSSQQILSDLLKFHGIGVELVANGAAVIKLFEQVNSTAIERFDLILMDWDMPEMSGIDTLKQLMISALPLPPVIIMSTVYAQSTLREHAAIAGLTLTNILTKPVTASTLQAAIAQALGLTLPSGQRNDEVVHAYQESATLLRGAHILLVEDNSFNQELVVALLTHNAMTVDLAWNGAEAIEMLQHNRYDGVLMDCQMPVMDGYAAVEVIRKDDRYQQLPILALTANVMDGDVKKALDSGMNDHIAKPVNVEKMFETMSRWIKPVSKLTPSAINVQVVGQPATQKVEQIDAEIVLPELSGLDVDAGLNLVSNNRQRYLRTLALFIKTQANKYQVISDVLDSGDREEIERIAHSLKSVLGAIGATELQVAAQEIELMVKKGEELALITEKFQVLQQQFRELYTRLESALQEPSY
jgi:two-component system sensor histidine kinase/response regulator